MSNFELSKQYSIDVLSSVERLMQESGADHRFVGGILAHPITYETTATLYAADKYVRLEGCGDVSIIRPDDTLRDLDLIANSPHYDQHEYAKRKLIELRSGFKQEGYPFPPVSIESTHYASWPTKRNRFAQLVSTLDVDANNCLHLTFGAIDQPTPWETLDPWAVSINGSLTLTTINLYGFPKRYYMRNASGLKAKDTALQEFHDGKGYSKIDLLQRVADSIQSQGLDQGKNYLELYETWDQFIDTLLNHPDPLTHAKALVTKIFWDTVGTRLSRGNFAGLGDRFTG